MSRTVLKAAFQIAQAALLAAIAAEPGARGTGVPLSRKAGVRRLDNET